MPPYAGASWAAGGERPSRGCAERCARPNRRHAAQLHCCPVCRKAGGLAAAACDRALSPAGVAAGEPQELRAQGMPGHAGACWGMAVQQWLMLGRTACVCLSPAITWRPAGRAARLKSGRHVELPGRISISIARAWLNPCHQPAQHNQIQPAQHGQMLRAPVGAAHISIWPGFDSATHR
jgi:hypothetical protein